MEVEQLEQRKEMIQTLFQDPLYKPMRLKELAMLLQVPKSQREDLKFVLDELLAEGKISISAKGKFGKPEQFALVGVFEGNARGFGFVKIEGMERDVFIPEDSTNGAIHHDKVQVVLVSDSEDNKNPEGKIVRILEHGITQVVGTYQRNKNFGFVVPDNKKIGKDIFIPIEKSKDAFNGHKVVAEIVNYGTLKKNPEGKVIEILGHVNDPGTDILSIAKAYELPMDFPEEVIKQIRQIPDEVDGKDAAGRLDLRSWQTVTIDGEDAKDLDDAITIKKENGRYTLGVHIADVTNYVTENSPLDKEALHRGTSVYLVDRVIPMLPHQLSNGICSLNQGCDRLALSCIMEVDEKGNVVDHRVAETIINVDRRMTYTAVKKILVDQDEEEIEQYKDFVPMFQLMEELSQILRNKRHSRGAIDFDFPESKIYLNENGRPIDIKPYERNVATKLIEDFMLLANETIAEDYFWQEIPFVYRIHDDPDDEKIMRFGTFINNFGFSIHFTNGSIHPKELQKLLDKIEGTPEEALISRLMLRSMKQAKYSTESTGHFGLSANYYCHFTSPIRRYPDLQIHRIIKENLHGGLNQKRISHFEKILPNVCEHASKTERRADEAEREVEKLKKVQYMRKFIGKDFEGVISGMSAHGLYVELNNSVEGFIHVSNMDGDYYTFVEDRYAFVGQTTGKSYQLGQKVRVVVLSTDPVLKTIDFMMYNDWFDDDIM